MTTDPVLDTDLQKIKYYFDEGRRLWENDSERVVTREFYQLWENVQKPRPFSLADDSVSLFDIDFDLPACDDEKIGYFCWDAEEMCPALTVESPEWKKKFLLTFSDGEPHIYENPEIWYDDDELSMGEKLEIVFDVIAWYKKNRPEKDILSLTKKEFVESLENVSRNHDPKSISAIKRVSARFLKNLIKKATADMATDEISRQLSLPLGGDYSTGESMFEEDDDIRVCSAVIPERTAWEVESDLDFLSAACRFAAENERNFVLTFSEAEIIGEPGISDVPFKLHINPEMPLSQGDILNVYLRGENDLFGTFKIDIFDGNVIFGRLRCDFPREAERVKDKLFARLQRSPRSYLAESVTKLQEELAVFSSSRGEQGALDNVLGLKCLNFAPGNISNAPATMDISQQKAWAAAVKADNPVVLIQGPPGTGKTYVLEQVARELCSQGLRILISAPSNTAVDNICRRIADLPVLRFGKNPNSISPDVAAKCWIGNTVNISRFVEQRKSLNTGGIYAGTHVGLMRDDIVTEDMKQNGRYDVIIFDEAGMANLEEFLLCAKLGKRAVLFGDHQQLPPFPLSSEVISRLNDEYGAVSRKLMALVKGSALEWLATQRGLPILMLQRSYRCQNPRLLRFSSTLFYDAGVQASSTAEYYQLTFHERKVKYPPSTLRFYTTSSLPAYMRKEFLFMEGQKPGLANPSEAYICLYAFYQAVKKYPLEEISIIAPYRKQVNLLRENISLERVRELCPDQEISEERWKRFIFSRIATVDSFQGGESDIVIICYVRSNKEDGIGFIDNPNRINVAHTRCRREINIVGDLYGLKRQAKNNIFERMERAFRRDGELIQVNEYMMEEIAQALAPTLR
jgi:hypothetical protein